MLFHYFRCFSLRPENPSDRKFFLPQLRLYDPCTRTNVSSSKILAHYAENEHFPPPIPRSLLSLAPCDILTGHGRGRGLGQRSNFALSTVVQSINVHYLPHPLSELLLCSIVPINQWHSEVTRREINNGHDLNILRVLTSMKMAQSFLSPTQQLNAAGKRREHSNGFSILIGCF